MGHRHARHAFGLAILAASATTGACGDDNSARDLAEVTMQYNVMFRDFPDFAAHVGCDPGATECPSEQDRADTVDYMQLLSFEGTEIRPPGGGR